MAGGREGLAWSSTAFELEWELAYTVWCEAGLVVLAGAKIQMERSGRGEGRADARPDLSPQLGVTAGRLARARAVCDGRAPLMPVTNDSRDGVSEARYLVHTAAFFLRALPPCMRLFLMPVLLRRLVTLVSEQDLPDLDDLRCLIVKPISVAL